MHGPGMDLLHNFFNNFDAHYIDQIYETFVNEQTLTIDYDYFQPYKHRLVIIDFSGEHQNEFEQYVYNQLVENLDLNFILLTQDHTKHQRYPRMFYFPYWYIWSKEYLNSDTDPIVTNKTKSYLLGCLNANPRPHRIVNYLKLRKKSYRDKISISFFNVNKDEEPVRSDDMALSSDELTEWTEIRSSLPNRTEIINSITQNLPQLVDSYLHLVTETTVLPGVFTSEKTWRPIAAATPFVMWGNPGTMSFLKQHGVDTYDDVIDHKYYDTEQDVRLRLDKLHQVIDDLIEYGVDKVYNQLLDRAINNQTKFFNGAFDYQKYILDLVNAINEYT